MALLWANADRVALLGSGRKVLMLGLEWPRSNRLSRLEPSFELFLDTFGVT